MIEREEIKDWIINWFFFNKEITKEEFYRDSELNFFEKEYIDSMGIIDFVTDIESHFEIKFEPENFQDKKFATIDGLSEIIGNRIQNSI
jgi:acyl carrier protein